MLSLMHPPPCPSTPSTNLFLNSAAPTTRSRPLQKVGSRYRQYEQRQRVMGRQERRTAKEIPARAAASRYISKQTSYANSHLFGELNSIVELFTSEQKELARSTGFSSFSKPVHAILFDRQFTAWLMPKVDNMTRTISVCPGKKLMMFQEDVAKVFGIPCGGKDPWDASLDKSQEMRSNIEGLLGMDEVSTSPSISAGRKLRELAGRELSDEEGDVFKVSFAVFVVCMLCDSNNPGEQEYDFAPEALHFCRTSDGVKQGGRLTAPNTDCASPAELLFDLLHLKNNTGSLPQEFVQNIED